MRNYLIMLALLTSSEWSEFSEGIANSGLGRTPQSISVNVRTVPVKPKKVPLPKTKVASVNFTRSEVLSYADTGAGSPYVWGGSRWSTENRKLWGADCSGFVQKAWRYPAPTSAGEEVTNHLTTAQFIQADGANYPWTIIDTGFSTAQPADAFVYRNKGGGHILLVQKTEGTGITSIEARSSKLGIGYAHKTFAYLQNKNFKLIRHDGL